MKSKIYLWIEDRKGKAGYVFWQTLMEQLCPEIVEYNEDIDSYNVEQLSAKILFDLTRNTGFEVSKANLGECWIKSCCEWQSRMDDDVCGLDNSRLQLNDKMKHIYEGTSLVTQFRNIGLEVAF